MMKHHTIYLTEGRTHQTDEDPRLSDLPISIRVELHSKGGARVVVDVAGNEVASLPLQSMVDIGASVYRPRGT